MSSYVSLDDELRREEQLQAQSESDEALSEPSRAVLVFDPQPQAVGSSQASSVSHTSRNAGHSVSHTNRNAAHSTSAVRRGAASSVDLVNVAKRAEELDKHLGFFLSGHSGAVNSVKAKKDGADEARDARRGFLVKFEAEVRDFFYAKLEEDGGSLANELGAVERFRMEDHFANYNMATGEITLKYKDINGQVHRLTFRATVDEIPTIRDLGAYLNDHTTCPNERIAHFNLASKGSYSGSRSMVETTSLQTERIRERVKIKDWQDFLPLFDAFNVPEGPEREKAIQRIKKVGHLQVDMLKRMDEVIKDRDGRLAASRRKAGQSRLVEDEIKRLESDVAKAKELKKNIKNIDVFAICFALAKPVYKKDDPINSKAIRDKAKENFDALCGYIGSKAGNPFLPGANYFPRGRVLVHAMSSGGGRALSLTSDNSLRSSEQEYARAVASMGIQHPLMNQDFNGGKTTQDTIEDALISAVLFEEGEAYFPHENGRVGVRPDFGMKREFGSMSSELREVIFEQFGQIPAFQHYEAGSNGVPMVGIRVYEPVPAPANSQASPPRAGNGEEVGVAAAAARSQNDREVEEEKDGSDE